MTPSASQPDHPAAPQDERAGFLRRRPWAFELILFAIGLLAYQGSRALVIGNPADAIKNALKVIGLEKAHGFFVETDIQGWLLHNIRLTEVLNQFYIWGHLPITAAFFVWMYRRRRGAYPFVRNAFFLANAIALTVFVFYPVAPPRLVGNEGFVDTLEAISGIDLHGGHLSGWFNPFAAVPSMHFAYALMIALVCAVLVRNWIVKALALCYPVLVFVTIIGTGNHFVLDAGAGAIVMLGSFGLMALWGALRHRHRPHAGGNATPT